MTSSEMILRDLKAGLTIRTDPLTRARYEVNNLPDVIYHLKSKGHDIKTTIVNVTKKNGKVVKVARYTLEI